VLKFSSVAIQHWLTISIDHRAILCFIWLPKYKFNFHMLYIVLYETSFKIISRFYTVYSNRTPITSFSLIWTWKIDKMKHHLCCTWNVPIWTALSNFCPTVPVRIVRTKTETLCCIWLSRFFSWCFKNHYWKNRFLERCCWFCQGFIDFWQWNRCSKCQRGEYSACYCSQVFTQCKVSFWNI